MVMRGVELRYFVDRIIKAKMPTMNQCPIKQQESMYKWAFRLGAYPDEATAFSQLDKEIEIWDDLAALMARSGYKSFSRGLRG
jgi:hypothetical protein